MKAIVIGGGIAGLATGVALRKVGIEATVFEQADSVREVGAGLCLGSNAVRMLHWLELPPSDARPIEEGITYDHRGRVLQRESLRAIHQRLGFASVCMERPALVDLLASKASVVTGARLKFWEHDAQGVTAHFENGREERGDFLVGADGIHSRVREILLGVSRPRFAGYTTWRALVDIPWERRTLVLGRGSQVGIFPCTATRTYWFATTNIPVPGARVPSPREFFRGWTDVWLDVLRRTPDEAILRNDVFDRPPVPAWGRGRVTMLGDSIHATTPNLGPGRLPGPRERGRPGPGAGPRWPAGGVAAPLRGPPPPPHRLHHPHHLALWTAHAAGESPAGGAAQLADEPRALHRPLAGGARKAARRGAVAPRASLAARGSRHS